MRRLFELRVMLIMLAVAALLGVAAAVQPPQPDLLQPGTWFASQEAVTIIGTLLAGYVVKLATALGKDWLQVDGPYTRYVAIAISVLLAGVGGYLSLGVFAGVAGLSGAFSAMIMVIGGYFGAVAQAEYDRQTLASGAERAEARIRTKLIQ